MALDLVDMLTGDSLLSETRPETVMLVAMVAEQIQSLGRYYYQGMWRDDPSELGEWLRRDSERMMSNPKERAGFLREEATREWMLWGRATDVLLDALERDTPVRLDRGRIIALAKRAGSKSGSRNIDPEQIKRRRKRENQRYKEKHGGPRRVEEPRLYAGA